MKKLILGIFILLIIAFISWNYFFKSSLIDLPVTFSSEDIPILHVNIQGREFPFELSLYSKYPIFINDSSLSKLKKTHIGEASWKNFDGKKHFSSLYQVPKIRIKNLNLKESIVVSEEPHSSESQGSFAWTFDKANLLLDLPHHKIWGVKNKKDLKKLGYDLTKFGKFKCKIEKTGIRFKAKSDTRELNLTLTSNCNVNAINHTLVNLTRDVSIVFGNGNIAKCKCIPYEISPEFELDGILGVPFLKKHIIYVDAADECLYIGQEYGNNLTFNSFSEIPLKFTSRGLPVAQVDIKGKNYPVIIDLGSEAELILPSQQFDLKGLQPIRTAIVYNMAGNEESRIFYALPKCRIGPVLLNNLSISTAKERIGVLLPFRSKQNGAIKDEELGYFGYPLLYRANVFFDFPHSRMWFINRKDQLKKISIDLNNYEKAPFELEKCGIVFSIDSDLGTFQFWLDTGTTLSLINSNHIKGATCTIDDLGNNCYSTQKFIIGNYNYGKRKLYPFGISEKFGNIDGILGMDFLRDHCIYIDFPNRQLYIEKN